MFRFQYHSFSVTAIICHVDNLVPGYGTGSLYTLAYFKTGDKLLDIFNYYDTLII